MTNDPVVLQSIVNDLCLDKPEADTRLDRLAMTAMQGLLSNEHFYLADDTNPGEDMKEFCKRLASVSHMVAEAMIRERERRLSKG